MAWRMSVRQARWALAAAVLAAAGCGGSAAPATSSAAPTSSRQPALQAVTMRLDFTPEGYSAPFAYGAVSGIFRRYGIALHLEPSSSSQVTVETTAKGEQPFGLADATTMAALAAKGERAVMVYGYIQTPPEAVTVNAASGITRPAQLVGKNVATVEAGPIWTLFPLVAKHMGINPAQIHFLSVSGNAKVAAVVGGKAVADLGFGPIDDGPIMEADGLKVRYFLYRDYGVKAEGLGVIVNPTVLKRHPGLVKRFVAAVQASVKAAAQHPRAAVAAQAKLFPGAVPSQAVMLKQLQGALPLMHTPATRGKPLGWMAASDWRGSVAIARQYFGAGPIAISSLYTNRFVP